jgi:beta,beta-carotene 9',10'-dioxygenase
MNHSGGSMAVVTAAAAYAKGFESLEEELVLDSVPVTGELPEWLSGSLLRTGPAKFEAGERSFKHWFDGLAMLHRFTLDGGRVSYGNRFLEGKTERAVRQQGRIAYPEFASDPCRTVFKRVQTLFAGGPEFGDSANINVVKLGDRFLSMTEAPISVEFDPETLASAGVPYMPPGSLTTAHPHADRADGAMLNVAVRLGARTEYRFYRVPADTMTPEVVASMPVREPGYIHSFGLTERWFVLAEFPWTVNPLRLALSGRPYAENYRWTPERGTRFILVDRAAGEAQPPLTTDACFAFHHVAAYEQGDELIVDACVYPDAGVIEDFYLDRVRVREPSHTAELRRFRLRPGAGTVSSERLIDAPLELAQINYARFNERPYRYTWGVGTDDGWPDRIIRADVEERSHDEWYEPDCWPGEPVFVARPDGEDEDDGVLLSVVLDGRRETSFLLVLDAHDLTELARAEIPHHIPFSFHGRYAAGVGVGGPPRVV